MHLIYGCLKLITIKTVSTLKAFDFIPNSVFRYIFFSFYSVKHFIYIVFSLKFNKLIKDADFFPLRKMDFYINMLEFVLRNDKEKYLMSQGDLLHFEKFFSLFEYFVMPL